MYYSDLSQPSLFKPIDSYTTDNCEKCLKWIDLYTINNYKEYNNIKQFTFIYIVN